MIATGLNPIDLTQHFYTASLAARVILVGLFATPSLKKTYRARHRIGQARLRKLKLFPSSMATATRFMSPLTNSRTVYFKGRVLAALTWPNGRVLGRYHGSPSAGAEKLLL